MFKFNKNWVFIPEKNLLFKILAIEACVSKTLIDFSVEYKAALIALFLWVY